MGLGNTAWLGYRPNQALVKEDRQRLQPYQWNMERAARGRDHWAMVAGRRGATRIDAYEVLWGILETVLPPHANPFSPQVRGTPLPAFINVNRWGVLCECGGFEVVDPDDPVVFCWSCGNAQGGADGHPRPVEFGREALAAETLLNRRPDPRNRSWDRPGQFGRRESLDDLIEEQEAHGDPVPPEVRAVAEDIRRERGRGRGAR